MSDIFISYKREEQARARTLANALESEGWTVWWDPKLRAGERFNDVIEKALRESKCVVVMWSKRSVESPYVRDEATYALNRNKLVPITIENVELPFRFEGLHTPSLLEWDGSKDFSEFRKLVEDISTIVRPSVAMARATAQEQHSAEARDSRNLEDITSRLIEYVAAEFGREQGVDLRKDPVALQRLREAAEVARISLSLVPQTEINLPFITADATGPKHILQSNRKTEEGADLAIAMRSFGTHLRSKMPEAGIQ